MAIKYIKGTHNEPLSKGKMGKMRLVVNNEDPENIWVKRFTNYSVLQNHSLNLMPFESWGAVIPSVDEEYDLDTVHRKLEIELHPEAWEDYLKAGVITEDGSFVKPDDRPQHKSYDTTKKESPSTKEDTGS